MTIWDSLAVQHSVVLAFERMGDSDWSWYALVDGHEVGGQEGHPWLLSAGTLSFDEHGSLYAFSQIDTSSTTAWAWEHGAASQDLAFAFGLDSTGDLNDGQLVFTGGDARVFSVEMDGYPWLVLDGGDCDDSDAEVYPGTEGCEA